MALAFAVVCGALLVGIGARLAGAAPAPGSPIALSSISAATLAANRISLTQPAGSITAVSAASAASVAQNAFGGASTTVREQVLADLTDSSVPGITNRLVWAVSIMPAGGVAPVGGVPGYGPPGQATWMLVFVDAQTGSFLYAESGGEVQTPGATARSQRPRRSLRASGRPDKHLVIANSAPTIRVPLGRRGPTYRVGCGVERGFTPPSSLHAWHLKVTRKGKDHLHWKRAITPAVGWYLLSATRHRVTLTGPSSTPPGGPAVGCSP